MNEEGLAQRLSLIARDLSDSASEADTLALLVKTAQALVDGCTHAGVTLTHRTDGPASVAATSDEVHEIDRLQFALDEGPCLDAAAGTDLVHSNDLASDPRWPRMGPQVCEQFGVRSVLAAHLFTGRRNIGALILYGASRYAFDARGCSAAQGLAAHAAIAIASARQVEELKVAVVGRTVVGQAQGILMERYQIDEQRAFEVLRRCASTEQRKLRDIAEELVRTRQTPASAVRR